MPNPNLFDPHSQPDPRQFVDAIDRLLAASTNMTLPGGTNVGGALRKEARPLLQQILSGEVPLTKTITKRPRRRMPPAQLPGDGPVDQGDVLDGYEP